MNASQAPDASLFFKKSRSFLVRYLVVAGLASLFHILEPMTSGNDKVGRDELGPACLSGDPACSPTERILEPEVRHHHRRRRKLLEFTHSSTRATMLMLAAAVAALVIENTPVLP